LASRRGESDALCAGRRRRGWGSVGAMKSSVGEKTFMGVGLRLGARLAVAALLALVLLLALGGPGSARTAGVATVTIGNAGNVPEGGTANFPVTLDQAAADDINVNYTVTLGSGTPTTGSLLIQQGQTSGAISVQTPSDDGMPNGDVGLSVTLNSITLDDSSDGSGDAVIGDPSTGTATVVDGDWQIGSIATTPGSATVSESGNTIDFQVSLQDPSGNSATAIDGHPITVGYTVGAGSDSAVLGK